MSPVGRRAVLIGAVVAVVGIVTAAVLTLFHGGAAPSTADAATQTPSEPYPTSAAARYLDAFASDDIGTASAVTDDPRASAALLRDAWRSLHPTRVQTTLGTVSLATAGKATAAYSVTWTLDTSHSWTYDATLDLASTGGSWHVHWAPDALHPALRAGQRLALVTGAQDQAVVVDRDGKPLVLAGADGTKLADPADFQQLRSALDSRVTKSDVFAVERVDSAGHYLQTLYGSTAGQPTLHATLSVAVQQAAQAVVNSFGGPAVIVAIQPSNGGLLAVAQNAQGAGASPFSGMFPPGSTFKIVTATAALEANVANVDSPLPCPLTEQIGTRTISNEGFGLGTIPMHYAFARSCNTTFGQLAHELPSNGLPNAAAQYGLAADFDIPGLTTQTGKVVPATDSDGQVEDGIGQGDVLVSPFGEALMAATVAAGHPVTPQLWSDAGAATSVATGYTAPPASVLAALRSMMREVVTDGTATGLARSGIVYGKTGTAQFGDGAQSHGWFVGYRGDIAFVVFLQGAGTSTPAVELAAKFLSKVQQP